MIDDDDAERKERKAREYLYEKRGEVVIGAWRIRETQGLVALKKCVEGHMKSMRWLQSKHLEGK